MKIGNLSIKTPIFLAPMAGVTDFPFRCLCKEFGEKKVIHGKEVFLFPKPERLAKTSIGNIVKCGLGYRSKYVKEAAIAVDKPT